MSEPPPEIVVAGAGTPLKRVFLAAEWRYLAMLNFAIDPAVLRPLVPPGTELDQAHVVLPPLHRAAQYLAIEMQHGLQVHDPQHHVVQFPDPDHRRPFLLH